MGLSGTLQRREVSHDVRWTAHRNGHTESKYVPVKQNRLACISNGIFFTGKAEGIIAWWPLYFLGALVLA